MGVTHQSAALATQACVLEPGSHVLMRVDHKGPHHEDFLPVFHNTLAALECSETGVRPVSAPPEPHSSSHVCSLRMHCSPPRDLSTSRGAVGRGAWSCVLAVITVTLEKFFNLSDHPVDWNEDSINFTGLW